MLKPPNILEFIILHIRIVAVTVEPLNSVFFISFVSQPLSANHN